MGSIDLARLVSSLKSAKVDLAKAHAAACDARDAFREAQKVEDAASDAVGAAWKAIDEATAG